MKVLFPFIISIICFKTISIPLYIHFYNGKRPHSVLMNLTPDKFESKYFNNNNKKTTFETGH